MADKIASMMAAGWVSIPEVKWDAMNARAARADKLEDALRKIKRWSDAWDEDFSPPLTDIEMQEYDSALSLAGLNPTRYNGELIRRILADVAPIVAEALRDAPSAGNTTEYRMMREPDPAEIRWECSACGWSIFGELGDDPPEDINYCGGCGRKVIGFKKLGNAAPPELTPEEDAADMRLARMARWGLPPEAAPSSEEGEDGD